MIPRRMLSIAFSGAAVLAVVELGAFLTKAAAVTAKTGPKTGPTAAEIEKRADALLARMTLEEKVDYLGGADGFSFAHALVRDTVTAATSPARLARAHARAGDPVVMAEYLGRNDAFDRSITDFSERYADQNEQDYEQFVKAIRSGRLQAVEGV